MRVHAPVERLTPLSIVPAVRMMILESYFVVALIFVILSSSLLL
jgi:hypothetical protein